MDKGQKLTEIVKQIEYYETVANSAYDCYMTLRGKYLANFFKKKSTEPNKPKFKEICKARITWKTSSNILKKLKKQHRKLLKEIEQRN